MAPSLGLLATAFTSLLAVPLPPNSCEQVTITHTNMKPADATTALTTYLTVLDEHGGGEAQLSRLVVSRKMTARLVDALGAPAWDVFVMGDVFSYSIHCARYVELAGGSWNVLLCQPLADHETGRLVEGGQLHHACHPPHVMRYDNGTLTLQPAEWSSSLADESLEIVLNFHKVGSEAPDEQGSPGLQAFAPMARDLLRAVPPEHIGPAMGQHVRQLAEERWQPADVWTVIVEAHQGQGGFPNWLEDAREHFAIEVRVGKLAYGLDFILFRRECWLPTSRGTR